MAVTLTPAQQAALDKFEEDATAATQAVADNATAQTNLLTAQHTAQVDAQATIDTHVQALQSAQAFVDSMLNPPAAAAMPTPAGSGSS